MVRSIISLLINFHIKVNLSLYILTDNHDMKTHWKSGSIDPRIHDLGTR